MVRRPSQRETAEAHRGGYTPVPLRCRYMLLVLAYILFLLALLEYTFQTIPQITARQTTQPDRIGWSVPASAQVPRRISFAPAPRRAKIDQRDNTDRASAGCNTTTSRAPFGNQTATDKDCPATEDGGPLVNILHLDPRGFAQLDTEHYIVHFRWNMVWIHDETGKNKIPVPPGMDISQRCTAYYADIIITDNEQDCQVLIQIIDYSEEEGVFYTWDDGPPMDSCPIQQADVAKGWGMGAADFIVRPPSATDDEYGCWNDEATEEKIFTLSKRDLSWPEKSLGDGAVKSTALSIRPTPAAVTLDGTVITLTDSLGQPTTTVTELLTDNPGSRQAGDRFGVPHSFRTRLSTVTYTDSDSIPTSTGVVTLTNLIVPGEPVSATVETILDSTNNIPISTRTRYILPVAQSPNPSSYPTPTRSSSNLMPSRAPRPLPTASIFHGSAIRVDQLTWKAYLAGSFAPVVLTSILSILVQVLSTSARTTAPFLLLSQSQSREKGGIPAEDSLLLSLNASNILRIDQAVRLTWRHDEPLLLLCTVLQILGIILVSLSSEAIGMTLGGTCGKDAFIGCFMSLAVVRGPARACEAILVAMAALVLAVMVSTRAGLLAQFKFLRRRKAASSAKEMSAGTRQESDKKDWSLLPTPGIYGNPTSIFSTMAMLAGAESRPVRRLLAVQSAHRDGGISSASAQRRLIKAAEVRRWLDGHRFTMNQRGEISLAAAAAAAGGGAGGGVQDSSEDDIAAVKTNTNTRTTASGTIRKSVTLDSLKRSYTSFTTEHRKQALLEHGLRVLLLAILCALLVIISYHGANQLWVDNPLEEFMASQTLGTSFLFTGAGGVIDLFWSGFFSDIELVEPYRRLSQAQSPRQTQHSHSHFPSNSYSTKNLLRPARSSSIFSGLLRALSNRNPFLSLVALTGVFSKFLSLLFANIPFRLTLTWNTFVMCSWTSVAILSLMILVLISSFIFARPYYLPIDPGTLAGRMYYVVDSWATRDLALLAEAQAQAARSDSRSSCDGEAGLSREREAMKREFEGRGYRFGLGIGVSGAERVGVDYVAVGKYV